MDQPPTFGNLAHIDLSAIPDTDDKLNECEYFLNLTSTEVDAQRFRWLISAFLNAVYSFIETKTAYACFSFTDPETGDPLEDEDALNILRRYFKIEPPKKRNSYFVKTSVKKDAPEPIRQIYEYRRSNTHYFALSIMKTGTNLPEDFHFGNHKGKGTPVLALCRDAMSHLRQLHQELQP